MFLKLTLRFFAVLLIFLSREVKASSSCAGTSGQSICILPSEQHYQFGATTSYRATSGVFDPYGYYIPNSDGTSLTSITTVLGGAYRLGEDWQLGLSIPIVRNERQLSGKDHTATSIGDPVLEGRYTLWEDLAFLRYRPQLSFYGGMRFPLGTSVYTSTDPSGVDVVGEGTPVLHAGIGSSKIYYPIKLTVDGTYFYPVAKSVTQMRGVSVATPYTLKSGNRFQLLESLGYLVNEKWTISAGLKQLWIFESSVDGNAVSGSAGRLFTTIASVNYFVNPAVGLGLSYETPAPFYQYLANQPNAQTVALAATYGGF